MKKPKLTAAVTEAPRDGLATVQQATAFLEVCRTTTYAMMRDGELPSVSIRNAKRIPWQALHKIVDAAMQESGGKYLFATDRLDEVL